MQGIFIGIGEHDYCVSENKAMNVNIITRLTPNEDGLMVLHEFVDFVRGCAMSHVEMRAYISNLVK